MSIFYLNDNAEVRQRYSLPEPYVGQHIHFASHRAGNYSLNDVNAMRATLQARLPARTTMATYRITSVDDTLIRVKAVGRRRQTVLTFPRALYGTLTASHVRPGHDVMPTLGVLIADDIELKTRAMADLQEAAGVIEREYLTAMHSAIGQALAQAE